ncbi:nitroreductase/quinone reductase family protein [Herbidospora cretacea]|uniref:nitroreductase/quinone reductase family protein n=1 Tax=Herbidospora cretacea TaxID=28444 RepID=UPI0004C3B0CB|nr:nitroreductase/quinone reductase family protein [Herbidospora cretacea]
MPTSFDQSVIAEFRANQGKVGGPFAGGDLLLLTTTGAKSGKETTTPLGYVRHGGSLLVVGSNLGAARHPGWYHNLLAHPSVRVELGAETFEALAIPAEGAQRDVLFEQVVQVSPGYADYQARTSRVLPVVVLEPARPGGVPTLAGKLLEVHTWLRGQLRQVTAEVEAHFAAGPGQPPSLGLQIRQRCLAFCQTLEFHHTGEDEHVFPGMASHHPHLAGTFDRLAAEHRTIARIQGELAALLADISAADPRRFRAELDRMSAELTAHLDHEEAVLLPLLAGIPWPPARP